MIYTSLTKKAMILAYKRHHNQVDKSGVPYIFHLMQVAEQMDNEISTTVALLHDILEDTNTTCNELLNLGFDNSIVETIKLMTKPDGIEYLDYIFKIKENPIAKKVKLADLKHNSNLSRLDSVKTEDLRRLKKYRLAIKMLEEQ